MPASKIKVPWFIYAYLVLATAYGIYMDVSQSGPYGWLVSLQLRWFGVYYAKPTTLVILVILTLPALIYIGILSDRARSGATPGPQALSESRQTKVPPWLGLLLIPLSLGVYAYLYFQARQDAERPIHPLTVTSANALPEVGDKFYRIRTRVLDQQYVLESTKTGGKTQEHYMAFVGEGWDLKQPIQFFYRCSFDCLKAASLLSQTGAYSREADGHFIFVGQRLGGAPSFLVDVFREAGYAVDAGAILFEMPLLDAQGRIRSGDVGSYVLIPILGIAFGLILTVASFRGRSRGKAIGK